MALGIMGMLAFYGASKLSATKVVDCVFKCDIAYR